MGTGSSQISPHSGCGHFLRFHNPGTFKYASGTLRYRGSPWEPHRIQVVRASVRISADGCCMLLNDATVLRGRIPDKLNHARCFEQTSPMSGLRTLTIAVGNMMN